MKFVFDIEGKKRAAGRYIGSVRRQLVMAVLKAEKEENISRSEIARRIGCHRSRITRQLKGTSDLTLRSIAEISWAIGKKPTFNLAELVPEGVLVNDIPASHMDIEHNLVSGKVDNFDSRWREIVQANSDIATATQTDDLSEGVISNT